jgi:serine/threonine protein kinase
LVCPHPSPLPRLGEGARDYAFLSGSHSPRIGKMGWGMRAKGLECTQLVLNLELLELKRLGGINYCFEHIIETVVTSLDNDMSNYNDFTASGYEVIRELGANHGAGRVAYLARKIDSQQRVVIKQFQFARTGASWDGYKAIDREIKILKQLQHPFIPRYLSSFETEHSSCIVQEYVDGTPLSEIISNQQLYTPEQAKEIILKLLEVLVYLQTKFTDPVLHRDIKPANILINDSREPYLIDFGGAKVSEGAGGSTLSVGTLGFMPPEHRYGQFNKTSDIYSLGLTIVCWLTRTEPNEMYTLINMGTNQVIGLRKSLSAYSLPFVDWIEKIVQPNPKDRYPDAKAAFAAFKPLYVKRVPETFVEHLGTKIVSSSVVEFTAGKLGERMTQTLMVRNNIPETVLKGWWEVAPHPSDPPHTPNSHAWISFGSRKFWGNANECSIVVNTDKLMAKKVYKRQILLHSNSSAEIETINITVKTAQVPIKAKVVPDKKFLYSVLFYNLVLFSIGITSYASLQPNTTFAVASAIFSILVLILFLRFCLELFHESFSISSSDFGNGFFTDVYTLAGIVVWIVFCVAVFVFMFYMVYLFMGSPSFVLNYNLVIDNFMLSLFLVFVFLSFYNSLIFLANLYDRKLESKNILSNLSILLLSVLSGIFASLMLFAKSHVWLIALLSTSIPLIIILLIPTITFKRLVSKYRDAEEGLIKP